MIILKQSCVFVVTVHSCVHVHILMSHIWVKALSPPAVQTSHIMLQCGRNHVGAFLPHHEVPL